MMGRTCFRFPAWPENRRYSFISQPRWPIISYLPTCVNINSDQKMLTFILQSGSGYRLWREQKRLLQFRGTSTVCTSDAVNIPGSAGTNTDEGTISSLAPWMTVWSSSTQKRATKPSWFWIEQSSTARPTHLPNRFRFRCRLPKNRRSGSYSPNSNLWTWLSRSVYTPREASWRGEQKKRGTQKTIRRCREGREYADFQSECKLIERK